MKTEQKNKSNTKSVLIKIRMFTKYVIEMKCMKYIDF